MYKKTALSVMLIISVIRLFAQNADSSDDQKNGQTDLINSAEDRVILASAVKDYPVTPGDVYKLSYMTASGIHSLEITVQSDYTLNLSVFGSLSALGQTYQELRVDVEKKVQRSYPGSKPSFIIQATGIFQVYLKGEVGRAEYITCWGLSRLSDVVAGRTTAYSSLRDLDVVAEDTTLRTYDLFSASHFGEKQQDPYVRPGDTIIIKRVQRQVRVYGEVFRPGTYQLLEGEGLGELISRYAGGFTGLSDSSRIRIIRIISDDKQSGEAYYLNSSDSLFKDFVLHDLDEVYIPNKKDSLPVVYFEGALELEQEKTATDQARSQKYTYRFVEGQKLASALEELYDSFSPEADLQGAYIIRLEQKEPIPVNIEELIHNYAEEKDITLMPYDRVVIPFRQYYVTVSGAVFKPGHYPYMPNRSYKYYLRLAGGTDPQKNVGEAVTITDLNDVVQSTARVIQPDDTIYAEYNNALYHANQWAVLIGTAVSVTALVLTIIQLSN
ncbi:MAG: SLBB domain-containing protein [Spirochaetales bacterium]|nr:SLBB domain-containing protein [Spirochaetales bacterium]